MRVLTSHPVALDSTDHVYPYGTSRDNSLDSITYNRDKVFAFIEEVDKYFNGTKITALDIGCAGGQSTADMRSLGNNAIGIEGSDYNIVNKRSNWSDGYNDFLFTCDASKPYRVVNEENDTVCFDLITAWEVIEHIEEGSLDMFFRNITAHMNKHSIFIASIDTKPCFINMSKGKMLPKPWPALHNSVFSEEKWKNEILKRHFSRIEDYPFEHDSKIRDSPKGFHVLLRL